MLHGCKNIAIKTSRKRSVSDALNSAVMDHTLSFFDVGVMARLAYVMENNDEESWYFDPEDVATNEAIHRLMEHGFVVAI